MGLTSTPLHDASVCISCGVPATVRGLDKAHVQSRARRPDLKEAADNQVLMCRRCHDAMDREHKFRLVIEDGFCVKQEWSNEVADFADVRRVRVVVDKKRGHLVEAPVLSAAAEGSAVNDPARGTSLHPAGTSASPSAAAPSAGQGDGAEEGNAPPQGVELSASAPSLSTKEESDGEHDFPEARDEATPMHGGKAPPMGQSDDSDRRGLLGDPDSGGPPVREVSPDSDSRRGSGLTHEQRVAIAREIKDAQQRRQFLAGDTANLWEEELGEDFWNRYANEFGYTYPSLRNVMRVCKSIPPAQRHVDMSFAHHEAVKSQDIETREAWLERAFEEEWPVKRLREELVAEGLLTTKPKVKRWSMDGLETGWLEWSAEVDDVNASNTVSEYLKWLGEQA